MANSDLRAKRKYRPSRSKLDKYADVLIPMRRNGTSYAEMRKFLAKRYRFKVSEMTIYRWIKKEYANLC